MKTLSLALLIFCLTSCSNSDLPDFNVLGGPRVLGLVADKPEANPGDVVTLTPVISDLGATAAPVDGIRTCVDLGVAFGVEPTCAGNPTAVTVATGRALTLPGLADNWTGLADSFSVTIPLAGVIFQNRTTVEKFNGVNYLVEYVFTGSNGVKIQVIKRIVVSDPSKTTKNLNPTFTDVYADGATLTQLPVGQLVQLSTDLASPSAEAYVGLDQAGAPRSLSEDLLVTWFITDGETKYYRSGLGQSTAYTAPPAAPIGRSAYIIAVARDDRGGLAVVRKKLN